MPGFNVIINHLPPLHLIPTEIGNIITLSCGGQWNFWNLWKVKNLSDLQHQHQVCVRTSQGKVKILNLNIASFRESLFIFMITWQKLQRHDVKKKIFCENWTEIDVFYKNSITLDHIRVQLCMIKNVDITITNIFGLININIIKTKVVYKAAKNNLCYG